MGSKSSTKDARKARPSRVVRTTVGELVAAAVDALGPAQAVRLLNTRSPLSRLLRQRLVVET